MGMQPLQDWVLIEPAEAKEKTAGGADHPRHGQGETCRRKGPGRGEGTLGGAREKRGK